MAKNIYKNIIFSQIVLSLISVLGDNIDTIIVGKFIGENALAACGVTLPFLSTSMILIGIVISGTKVVCSRAIGENNEKKATKEISTTFNFILAFFSIVVILLYIFVDPVISMLVQGNHELFYLAKSYIMGFMPIILICGICSLSVYILQINNLNSYLILGSIVLTILDIALDLLNIFVFNMGLFGIGLSSTISYLVMMLIFIFGIVKHGKLMKVKFLYFKIKYFINIFKNGINGAIGSIAGTLLVFVINFSLLKFWDSTSLSAVTAVITIYGLLCIIPNSLSYCTSIISAMFYGEKNKKELKSTINIFLKWSIIVNLILSVIAIIFANYIVLLFLNIDDQSYVLAVDSLKIISSSTIFYSIAYCYSAYLNGIKKITLSCVFETIIYIFILLFCLLFIPNYNVSGVAISYVLGFIITMVIFAMYISIRKKTNPFSINTYSLIPKSIISAEKNVYEQELKNEDEVLKMSSSISEFCKKYNADLKTRMALSLVIEELGLNVFKHGVKNKKNLSFEIRILYDEISDTWTLRTRDNCKEFDPVKFLELNNSADKTSNLGLTLALGLAKKSQYTYITGLNNLIIEL